MSKKLPTLRIRMKALKNERVKVTLQMFGKKEDLLENLEMMEQLLRGGQETTKIGVKSHNSPSSSYPQPAPPQKSS